MTVNLSALAGAGGQFLDANGNPLTGGKLYSYAAGTTTPQATYTSVTGTVPHTNPIILDAAGRIPGGEIWLTAALNYKFFLTSSTDVTIATWDNITGINGTGIATNASNVTFDPAGAGAVPTTVQAKLRESVSVKDFGAVGDGATNDTAAFVAACAQTQDVFVPPGTYLLTPTGYELKVFCRLFGVRGASIINITINSTLTNGFCMQPNSALDGLTINRNLTLTTAGADGNAVACWPSGTTNPVPQAFTGISLTNLTIVGTGVQRNLVTFLGNISNFEMDNLDISGVFLSPILIHWRRLPSAPFDSYHPRQGRLTNITCSATSLSNARNGPYFAATHDIYAENIKTINCEDGIVVAAGDIGGLFAVGESTGKVLSNMTFVNVYIENPSSKGFWVAGRSDFQSSIDNRWFMTDPGSNVGVTINGLTIACGPGTTTSTEPFDFYFAKNVSVSNLNLYAPPSEVARLSTMWGIWFRAAVNCSVQGRINLSRGVRSVNSLNCVLRDSIVTHNRPMADVASADYGVTAQGALVTAVAAASVSLGATSVRLSSVPADIYPGMIFTNSGNTFVFTQSATAGDTSVTVGIQPAPASLSAGAILDIQSVTDSLGIVRNIFSGFSRNINIVGATGARVKETRVTLNSFSYCQNFHANIDEVAGINIDKNSFERGNQGNTASGYDIALRELTGAMVSENIFGADLDNKSVNNIYNQNGNVGAVIQNNVFLYHNINTTTYPLASSVYLSGSGAAGAADIILGSNYFGPAVVNQVLPASSRRSVTVGSNRIGFATAIPTGGVWRQGDKIFNINAAAGQPKGWVCTVAGEPGTWVSEGNL